MGKYLITDPTELEEHVVTYFTNIFGFVGNVQDSYLIDIIPSLVNDAMNATLAYILSDEEITSTVFGLKKESAPNPDGFGGVLFQTYWNIIHIEVYNSIWQFFKSGWMLPNYNSITIILLPKTLDADTIGNFSQLLWKILSLK